MTILTRHWFKYDVLTGRKVGEFIVRFFAYVFAIVILGGMLSFAQTSMPTDATPKTPFTDEKTHEGVMGCYGSTCHSRQEATGVVVRQNEILTWEDQTSTTGAHARAFDTLLNARSKSITDRLNMGPASEAPECLSCHADGIAPIYRGDRFHIDDGVGCESCHGAAGDWLTQHYAVGADHNDNVANGMLPLENASVRATVCLSCHLGSEAENQFVSHRFMAAGHPRLAFETDLFTALQSHHSEDYDYKARKTVQTGAQIWAIGQAMSLKQQLRLFSNQAISQHGLFPELVFFDCLACHRPISEDPEWRPTSRINPGRPATPGQVKFNDANMIMLLAVARKTDPSVANRFDNEIKTFHESLASNNSDPAEARAALMATANEMIDIINRTNFSKDQTLDILDIVVTETLTRRYTDYVAAEQAIMAVDTLLSSMIAAKQVPLAEVQGMRDEINIGYDAVENPNVYDQALLTEALETLHARLGELR